MSTILRGIDNFDSADSLEHISVPTAYHIYNGEVTATNTVITNGFSTTLYTGNGATQSINTGIDMSTQWGDDVSETFGGLTWLRSRSNIADHILSDTIDGATKYLSTNGTNGLLTATSTLTSFNSNGFSLGNSGSINANTVTYASWNFQTTHRRTGTTNHGKAFTEHYNPETGFTIIKYEGSGLAGHEIPHSLGRKLGIWHIKNLSATNNWIGSSTFTQGSRFYINGTSGLTVDDVYQSNDTDLVIKNTYAEHNTSTNEFIMYGWANSYLDETNKLIGNYEIGTYQGTGAAGNKIITRDKPAWVMIKRLDAISDWTILDNLRTAFDVFLNANTPTAEQSYDHIDILVDGFTLKQAGQNAAGGQYLYMVVYDNDSGSGKSKYPRATDTTNLSINALVPYANGIDSKGSKVSIEYKNETITGITLTQGKNYPYSKNDGTYGVNKYEPMYGALRNRVNAGETPDYFDLSTQKWYSTTGGSELVTNGTFSDGTTTGWTAVNGASLSVYNNTLKVQSGTTDYAYAKQDIYVEIGKTYRIRVRNVYNSVTKYYSIVDANGNGIKVIGYEGTTNTENIDMLYKATTNIISFMLLAGSIQDGAISMYDDISVFEAIPNISTEIAPRNYLDCIVYADQNGQVEYVEQLAKTMYFDKIETANNRVVMYLEDYGVSAIQNAKRYVITNPFGNNKAIDCDAKVEIYYNNRWAEPNWDGNSGTGNNSYGVRSGSLLEGIVIQTGITALRVSPSNSGALDGGDTTTITSAPARVIITFNGSTKGVK